MTRFYITRAIDYANGKPHMGHALESVQGDALARYNKTLGKDVRYLTGMDEHGSKNQETAEKAGMSPQELVDQNAEFFKEMYRLYNVEADDFIRTTSERHKVGARALWRRLEDAGMIYEKEYEGLYCTGCESFKADKDLVDGLCPDHQRAPQPLKESNLFFKLSSFNDAIKEKVKSGELQILPESRRNEFLGLLEKGLHDVSFSRPKSSLEWGIEVPEHEDHVMYVWCDALSNYVTALGYGSDDTSLMERYWPADVHLIGKDILRFHCGIWMGMLLAADLPLPKAIYIHGWITSEGQKMSKSLGNVLDPVDMVQRFGTDPLRYYLLREVPTGSDGDFSMERFQVIYGGELQNTLGNLLRRVVAMTIKYFEGKMPAPNGDFDELIEQSWAAYHKGFTSFDMKASIEAALYLAREANAYIEENKPWALAKEGSDRLEGVMGSLLQVCQELGKLLEPIIPASAERWQAHFKEGQVEMGEPMFGELEF